MAEPSAIAASVASAERLRAGLWRENPVLVQALGMCPTLAVSNTATNALTMGLATAAVLLASAVVISAIRGLIPPQVRLACFVLVIATFVTVASLLLEAFAPALHGNLGAFLSLIVVNCIILGRIEAVASRQPVHVAAADALGMGGGLARIIGEAPIMLASAAFRRELAGFGVLDHEHLSLPHVPLGGGWLRLGGRLAADRDAVSDAMTEGEKGGVRFAVLVDAALAPQSLVFPVEPELALKDALKHRHQFYVILSVKLHRVPPQAIRRVVRAIAVSITERMRHDSASG